MLLYLPSLSGQNTIHYIHLWTFFLIVAIIISTVVLDIVVVILSSVTVTIALIVTGAVPELLTVILITSISIRVEHLNFRFPCRSVCL